MPPIIYLTTKLHQSTPINTNPWGNSIGDYDAKQDVTHQPKPYRRSIVSWKANIIAKRQAVRPKQLVLAGASATKV